MASNNRKSLVGFVLVAVVLAGLLFGGIYLSKKNLNLVADNSRDRPTSEVSESNDKTADSTGDKKTDETAQKSPENSQSSTDKSTTTKKDEPAKTNQGSGENKSTSASTLPQTGPTEDLISVLGLGAIAAAAVTYHQSRKKRLSAF